MINPLPRRLWLSSLTLMVACLFFQKSSAQVVLYVEIMTEERPMKFYEGQTIELKTNEYSDDWQKIKMERFLQDENLILYDGGMIDIRDISKIRLKRGWAQALGTMLQTFGFVWTAYGGIIHFTDSNFDFGVDTAVIGGGAYVSGWLLKKFFKYKVLRVGKKVRVKFLDISWPEPRG